MFVSQNRGRKTFELAGLTRHDMLALLRAVTHELVRSAARQKDPRISEESRDKEAANCGSLEGIRRRISAHEADFYAIESQTVH